MGHVFFYRTMDLWGFPVDPGPQVAGCFSATSNGRLRKKSGAISSKVGTIADCMCNICMLFYMQCNIIYIYQ